MISVNNILVAVFSITISANQVLGHGQMTYPANRRDMQGQAISAAQKQQVMNLIGGPTTNLLYGHRHTANSFRCHDFGPTANLPLTTLRAGETFPVNLQMSADHSGDCAFYMSDKNQSQDQPENWYKIAHFPGCGNDKTPLKGSPFHDENNPLLTMLPVKIPDDIPKCEHCVLRFEWLAVHMSEGHPFGYGASETATQYFVTCSDVRVENDRDDGTFRPDYTVAINGIDHLTADPNYPRDRTHRNPYNDNNFPASGYYNPPVATFITGDNNNNNNVNAAVLFHSSCGSTIPTQTLKKGQYNTLQLDSLFRDHEIVSMTVKPGYALLMFSEDEFNGKHIITLDNNDGDCYQEFFNSGKIRSVIVAEY